MKKILFSLCLSLFLLQNVNAASKCEYSEQAELNSLVANIKATYEEKERIVDPEDYTVPDSALGTPEEETYVLKEDYLQISIMNLVEKFYLKITNDHNGEVWNYSYEDSKDGRINIDWNDLSEVTTFTIKVYSSEQTGCKDESYKTIYLTLPRKNEFYIYGICRTASDFYMCQKFVTFNEVSFETFEKRVYEHLNKQGTSDKDKNAVIDEEQTLLEKIKGFYHENKTIMLISGVVVLVAVGAGVVVIIKKRRSNDL